MTRQSKTPSRALSDSEWEVMKVLWEHGPMAARDVYARLAGEQPWASVTGGRKKGQATFLEKQFLFPRKWR